MLVEREGRGRHMYSKYGKGSRRQHAPNPHGPIKSPHVSKPPSPRSQLFLTYVGSHTFSSLKKNQEESPKFPHTLSLSLHRPPPATNGVVSPIALPPIPEEQQPQPQPQPPSMRDSNSES